MPTQPAAADHDRPVFVLAQHRSGGTLLTRLLNCHPGLVIWGEHAGVLNKLAEAQEVLQQHADLLPARSPAELQRYASGREVQTDFRPWMVPFGCVEFLVGCRTLVRDLFAPVLQPGQRWGFKEIRYHSPKLVRFLRQLFPAAQFVLLDRDPIELCVSDMLVSWALEQLMTDRIQHDCDAFRGAVEDCLYAILAVRRNLGEARGMLGDRAITVRYELLAAGPEAETERVFGFLGLPTRGSLSARLRLAAETVAGATDKSPPIPPAELGLLKAARIRETARESLPRIAAQIAREGIDDTRLRRERSEGRYSYLVGDHAVAEMALSTMF